MKGGFPIFKFLSFVCIVIIVMTILGIPLPFLPTSVCYDLFAPRRSIYIPPHYCYVHYDNRYITYDISTGTFH